MVNKNSAAYKAGRIVGRIVLLGLGYVMGKRWGRKSIDKSFPENINFKLISKDQFITSTSAVVGLKITQTKLFDVIAGATTNLYI